MAAEREAETKRERQAQDRQQREVRRAESSGAGEPCPRGKVEDAQGAMESLRVDEEDGRHRERGRICPLGTSDAAPRGVLWIGRKPFSKR